MNKKFKKFLIIYLAIGVIWATLFKFPFGIMLREYEGIHSYDNDITAVTHSYLTDSGDLVLCMQGRLSNSERYPTEITEFSLVIPLKFIYSNKSYLSDMVDPEDPESNVLGVSDKLFGDKCDNPIQNTQIQVLKANYTPRKSDSFHSVKDLDGLKPMKSQNHMIYVVPTANEYPEWHFMERVRVFIINQNPDIIGRNNYIIGIRRTQFDRNIGLHEYAIAFTKDALFYPFSFIMMGMWGH
jgi:hypothetical protein